MVALILTMGSVTLVTRYAATSDRRAAEIAHMVEVGGLEPGISFQSGSIQSRKASMLRGVQYGKDDALSGSFENLDEAFVVGTAHGDLRRRIVARKESFKCPGEGNEGEETLLEASAINDEFCDCQQSGWDEPGTSACASADSVSGEPLFFCGESDGRYISSSRVRDKICDCCDGSDEGPGSGNCEDLCDELREEFAVRKRAMKLAKTEAESLIENHPQVKGLLTQGPEFDQGALRFILPDHDVFDDGEFSFELTVTDSRMEFSQRSKNSARRKVDLGKNLQWDGKALRLMNGSMCPGNIRRMTVFSLQCDKTKKLVRVVEESLCSYRAFIMTPFGCLLS